MSTVTISTGESFVPVAAVAGAADRPRRAAPRHRRGFWSGWWWEWLGASAVAYPGGGIVHLMSTAAEE